MELIIVGAGASGLIAGIEAARNGANVTILEKSEKIGRKILASGNGRCNLTNINQGEEYYRSDDTGFAWGIINQFNHFETMRYFTDMGIYTKNKNDYIYPFSEQAASVVEVLLMEAEHLKVKIKTREEVISVKKIYSGFVVKTKTWKYNADKVIVATGSPASLGLEIKEDDYKLAMKTGHSIIKPLPALVALDGVGDYFHKWAGVRMEGSATLLVDEEPIITTRGELQFTDYGISGIPTFSLSRFVVKAIDEGKQAIVVLDLMPDFTMEFLVGMLNERMNNCPYKSLSEMLIGLLPKKMISIVASSAKSLEELATWIKTFPILIKNAHSLEQAQICSGGVSTKDLNPETLESKTVSGLYFTGEVVDVDGDCGGYNLQWAWSSGIVAARSMVVE